MKRKSNIVFFAIVFIILTIFIYINYFVAPKKYRNYVVTFSQKYELNMGLVYAIIKVESNFDKNAKSSAGAMGLMQIIPNTAKWIAGELEKNYENIDLFSPETNIQFGCYYLSYLFSKFDDIGAVICAYNAGENAVKNWLDESGKIVESKISYRETLNYYHKVIKYYNIYNNKFLGE